MKSKIELYNDDCLNYLKSITSESIDLVLIDPPYEISRDSGFQSSSVGKYKSHSISFGEWDYEFTIMEDVVKEAYRVLRKGGTLFCFYDLWKLTTLKGYFETAKFKQLRYVEWIKTNPVPINSKTNYLTNSREIAISGVKGGKPTFNSSYDNGVYSYPICHEKGRFHPTQKPLKLISDIVLKHSNEGDVVLDCFSGSGTTAISCLINNRNFTGCELSTEFYEKSLNRLENYKQ